MILARRKPVCEIERTAKGVLLFAIDDGFRGCHTEGWTLPSPLALAVSGGKGSCEIAAEKSGL